MATIGLETSQYTRSYTAFSGIDMNVVAYNVALTTIQGISYSITREKAPVYTMGSANPRAFTRGKRGIAGSCIFTVFDRHPLAALMEQSRYVAKDEEINTEKSKAVNEIFSVSDSLALVSHLQIPQYADQIPPFDVTMAARNEYGQSAAMRIYSVEFLNEGSGTSVDDTNNESQMTFVARHISHWKPSTNELDSLKQGRGMGFTIVTGTTGASTLTDLSTGQSESE